MVHQDSLSEAESKDEGGEDKDPQVKEVNKEVKGNLVTKQKKKRGPGLEGGSQERVKDPALPNPLYPSLEEFTSLGISDELSEQEEEELEEAAANYDQDKYGGWSLDQGTAGKGVDQMAPLASCPPVAAPLAPASAPPPIPPPYPPPDGGCHFIERS